MLYLLALIASIFTFLNYRLSKSDLMAPNFIFHSLFLIQIVLCILAESYLKLEFHYETVLILATSFIIFTVVSTFFLRNSEYNSKIEIEMLDIPKSVVIFLIVLGLIIIYLKLDHINRFAEAINLDNASLDEKISQLDKYIKFKHDEYLKIAVLRPRYYNILNPISTAFGYILSYITVNNFIKTKKIDVWNISVILLMVVGMYLSGSRSPIFRLITFVAFVYYVLAIRHGMSSKKLNRLIIVTAVGSIVLFMSTISFFGRKMSYSLLHYFFIYVGAPLYNLDVFIQKFSLPIPQDLFGQQTFHSLYTYILPKLGLEQYSLDLPFVRYNEQYGLGNVYTTFYQFLYDFGILGFIVPILVIAVFYSFLYRTIRSETSIGKRVDFKLFLYAFFFNDLIMLFFSNRFFETLLNQTNLRILLVAYFGGQIVLEKKIQVFGKTITLDTIKSKLWAKF